MRKSLTGTVLSDKMQKTVVVEVKRVKQHPLYKKRYTESKKFYVHDLQEEAAVGDRVEIEEVGPISKKKNWRLVRVIEE